jgi:uncharacterized protein (TIGR02722 family)
MKISTVFTLSAFALVLAGCETTTSDNPLSVTTSNPLADSDFQTFSLEKRDFDYAASKALNQFLDEPNSIKPDGGRWVTQLYQITNDTTVNVDIRTLTQQLKRKMRRSGRFIFTSATGDDQTNSLSDQRALAESDLFDQSTVADSGTVIAPELSIEGGIFSNVVTSSDNKKQQISYVFTLEVIDIDTGLIIFETLIDIDKAGSNKNFSW